MVLMPHGERSAVSYEVFSFPWLCSYNSRLTMNQIFKNFPSEPSFMFTYILRKYRDIACLKVVPSIKERVLLTDLRSWAFLEKLPIVQPLKNIPAFYGTRSFISVFTRGLHWSLSWASSIQSITSHPILLRFILTLSTHLLFYLPSGLFPSGFPTNILYAFIFSILATCPAHIILFDLINLVMFGEEYN
jgi:hypothetical protein